SVQERTADFVQSVSASLADGLERLIEAIDQSSSAVQQGVRGRQRRHGMRRCPKCGSMSDCDCAHDPCCDDPLCEGECHDDACHCQCCVTDADLLVQARLGEL